MPAEPSRAEKDGIQEIRFPRRAGRAATMISDTARRRARPREKRARIDSYLLPRGGRTAWAGVYIHTVLRTSCIFMTSRARVRPARRVLAGQFFSLGARASTIVLVKIPATKVARARCNYGPPRSLVVQYRSGNNDARGIFEILARRSSMTMWENAFPADACT